MITDLNNLKIKTDVGDTNLYNNNTQSLSGDIQVFFRDIKSNLINCISNADIVVGCVAWLTDFQILESLIKTKGVSIVVQKEDFLRPDVNFNDKWKHKLRRAYENLPKGPERYWWSELVGSLSVCGDPTVHPVRCVGNYNRDKKPAFPRMHNKFLVFCKYEESRKNEQGEYYAYDVYPYQVWTGSFNLTLNAGMSLENALLISDSSIVKSYFKEWENILALSENLNWETDWSEPEWRIGT